MCDLRTYLKRRALTQAEFASELGRSQGSVSRAVRGDPGMTLRQARRVIEATGGEVTIEALYQAAAASDGGCVPAASWVPEDQTCNSEAVE